MRRRTGSPSSSSSPSSQTSDAFVFSRRRPLEPSTPCPGPLSDGPGTRKQSSDAKSGERPLAWYCRVARGLGPQRFPEVPGGLRASLGLSTGPPRLQTRPERPKNTESSSSSGAQNKPSGPSRSFSWPFFQPRPVSDGPGARNGSPDAETGEKLLRTSSLIFDL